MNDANYRKSMKAVYDKGVVPGVLIGLLVSGVLALVAVVVRGM